jgi:hypothetical protein
MQAHLDGVLVDSEGSNTRLIGMTFSGSIGITVSGGEHQRASFDDIRIYSMILTTGEITKLDNLGDNL